MTSSRVSFGTTMTDAVSLASVISPVSSRISLPEQISSNVASKNVKPRDRQQRRRTGWDSVNRP
jgi:hypothetical protein